MGSRFPERRNPEYRAFIRGHDCLLRGRWTLIRLCPYDKWCGMGEVAGYYSVTILRGFGSDQWQHVCWGRIDPAHVNETVARGAYDVGETVPLCRGAHRMLDQVLGPAEFAQVTGLDLSNLAAGFALKYAEQGGRG